GLYIDECELSGVCAAVQVSHRHYVCMDKAGAGGLRRQLISNMAVGRDLKTLLFGGAVYGCRDYLAMPVNELGSIRIVEQLDRNRDAFAQADEWAGDGSVVSNGAEGWIFG